MNNYINHFLAILIALSALDWVNAKEIAYENQFEYSLDETYEFHDHGVIEILTEDADLQISATNRPDVYIQAYRYFEAKKKKMLGGYKFELVVDHSSEGKITIAENKVQGVRNLTYSNFEYWIKIEIPENCNLSIQEEDGTITVSNFYGSIMAKFDDGSISLINYSSNINLECDNCTLTGSGNKLKSVSINADHLKIDLKNE